jgi:lactate dehydrogenase-like 2-hydroxyacid dehydrogenase
MKPHVLSLGHFPPATMNELAERFTRHHFSDVPVPPDALPAEIWNSIRAIATEANRGADRELIARLPKLEVISVFGVGLDAIDLKEARARGIPVTNTPGILGPEVADLAIGLMLASARQIVLADRFVRDGEWVKGPVSFGRSVNKKTMGVVGLGEIGRAIADRGKAFGMRVIYHGPRKKPDAPFEYYADLVRFALESDFLIVACKGGPDTYRLISAEVIDALGAEGTLVNVARGTVVDEPALIKALRDRRLGYAALDVFENEPNISGELLSLPNVIVQPHHGSSTIETRTAMGKLMIDNVVARLANQPLLTLAS